jgi:hypothetical protein
VKLDLLVQRWQESRTQFYFHTRVFTINASSKQKALARLAGHIPETKGPQTAFFLFRKLSKVDINVWLVENLNIVL